MEYVIDPFEKQFPPGFLCNIHDIPDELGKVYLITNLVNGKVYVGQTWSSIRHRWAKHRYQSTFQKTYFYQAIKKYGTENFGVGLLALADTPEELNNLEKLWITSLNSADRLYGYNSTWGGEGGTHNKETSGLLSRLAKERWANPVFREKTVASLSSPECTQKMAEAARERWTSEDHRSRVIGKQKERWADPEYKARVTVSLRESGQKPEFKEKMSIISKRNWENPAYREKRAASLRTTVDDPEYRAKRSLLSQQMWEDPSFREKHAKTVASPESKAKRSAASKLRWENPEYREKIILAQNEGKSRRKQNV